MEKNARLKVSREASKNTCLLGAPFVRPFLSALLSLCFTLAGFCNESWELVFQPRQRVVKSLATYKNQTFAGTGNGVFVCSDNEAKCTDFGLNELQKDSTGNSRINWIHIDNEEENIYIATSFGAYFSKISKPAWKKFFEGTKTESNEINSITTDKNNAYLGTNDGFWVCTLNNTKQAHEESFCTRLNQGLEPDAVSGNYEIYHILKNNDDLFLSTSNGIYLLQDKDLSWMDITNGIQKLPSGRINARHLLIDEDNNFWVASGSGVYISKDRGKTWEKKSKGIRKNNDGFQEAFYLLEDNDNIYAACASGIYSLYKEDYDTSWQDITYGIRTKENSKNVYCLSNTGSNLLAATDEGLFALNISQNSQNTTQSLVLKGKIESDFANLKETEPTVIEVQKQALKFAALPTTNDYKRYRWQARVRNLIPKVGFDLNSTGTNTNYYQQDRGISTNISLDNKFDAGRISRLQQDDKSFKQFSILWNTNEFIYDDEIREILNQARLTANIRENLLDDVTRIYYQRKKLQLESLTTPAIEEESKVSKELEIAELTGQLDSRTGGWFSRELERRRQ